MSGQSNVRHAPGFSELLHGSVSLARCLRQQIVAYFLIFAVLQAFITGPATAWLLDGLIESSGERAIGNFDIAVFLLSPVGLGFLLAAAATTLFLVLVTLAGLMLLAESAIQTKRVLLSEVFHGLRRRLAALGGLTGVGLAIGAMILLPMALLLLLIKGTLLAEHDINYYLSFAPTEFKLALLFAVLVLLPAVVAAIAGLAALIFALPFLLFEDQGALAALRSARSMLLGRYRLLLSLLGRLLAAVLLLSMLLHGAVYLVTKLWIGLFGFSQSLLLPVLGLSLAATVVIATLIVYLTQCATAFAVLLLWRGLRGQEIRVPPRAVPWRVPHRALVYAGLSVALAASLLISHRLIGGIEIEDRVLNVAHRGSSIRAPENLLSAVKQAAADGADAAEIDVQRSADGVVVLAHDRDMMRIAGQPLVISQTKYAELRKLDVGGRVSQAFAGEPIPSLDEVVSAARASGLELLIELKSYGDDGERLAREVLAVLREHSLQVKAIIMSLNYAEIRYLKAHFPDVKAGFLASAALGNLTRLDADFLAVSLGMLSDTLIATLHADGKKVCVWTIDDKDKMSALIDRGVDCIITNTPERLVEVLAERRGLTSIERLLLRYAQVY